MRRKEGEGNAYTYKLDSDLNTWYPDTLNAKLVGGEDATYWSTTTESDTAELWKRLVREGKVLSYTLDGQRIWTIDGNNFTCRVAEKYKGVEEVKKYLASLLPWKAISLGTVDNWHVFDDKGEKVQATKITRHCFSTDNGSVYPYQPGIFFRDTTGNVERYMNGIEGDPRPEPGEMMAWYIHGTFEANEAAKAVETAATEGAQAEADAAQAAVKLATLEIATANARMKTENRVFKSVGAA